MRQWIIIGAVALLLIASYVWNRSRSQTENGETIPPVEEIITQEDGTVVKRTGDVVQELSEEEVQAKREEINQNLENIVPETFVSQEGETGTGTTTMAYKDGTYYQKIEVSNLNPLDKGFFYEAWIENPEGNKQSIGRMEMQNGSGILYYSAKEDRSGFTRVYVTREAEDGNPQMGDVVLQVQE